MKILLVLALILSPTVSSARPVWCERLLARFGQATRPVHLRPATEADLSALIQLGYPRSVYEMMAIQSARSMSRYLKFLMSRNLEGIDHLYVIEFGREVAGLVNFSPYADFGRNVALDQTGKWFEVSYFVGKKFWNLGIGRKALDLGLTTAFKNLDARGLVAFVYKSNKRSLRVLENNGFTPVVSPAHDISVLVRKRFGGGNR